MSNSQALRPTDAPVGVRSLGRGRPGVDGFPRSVGLLVPKRERWPEKAVKGVPAIVYSAATKRRVPRMIFFTQILAGGFPGTERVVSPPCSVSSNA